ncbi:hypothetical protein [Mesorhizobium sp. SP-1A]|uniref:hypothetical protein n=1 Tax=Mesorhizobium sp. SP-1A TaxID=3077840 RepID=UPI0028F70B80|nr:hypothetical protein [Mesorhizobium sp. SP-1A]
MVDNPKNNPADDEPFDFGADWGGAETSADDFSPEDMDFGNGPSGSGGSDVDNPFALSGDDNPFAQGGDDDIFANAGAFEEDDSFHSMPTPDNLSAEMEGEANPADDFGDLSTDVSGDAFGEPSTDGGFGGFDDFGNENDEPQSFASQDGFESADGLFGGDASGDAFATEDDGFGSQEENVYAEGEGFASEEMGAEEVVQAAPVANSGGRGKGMLVLAGMAAAVLGIGYVGYTSVAPMFFGGGDQPNTVVSDVPQAPINQFPTALPGQDGGLPLPAPAAEDVASPPLPTVPAPVDAASPVLPSIPSATQQEQNVADAGSPLAPVPDLPSLGDEKEAPSLTIPEVGEASAPPLGLPSVPTPASEDDLVSGDRGGITAMREQEDAAKSQPISAETAAELKAVLERISSLEASVDAKIQSVADDLNGRLSDLESKLTSGSAVVRNSVAGSSEAPVSPTRVATGSQPPLKPTIVEHMSLKGVSRGMAWVKTDTGIIEARVGDSVGDVGRVLGITEYNGAWMVSTEKGLILQ